MMPPACDDVPFTPRPKKVIASVSPDASGSPKSVMAMSFPGAPPPLFIAPDAVGMERKRKNGVTSFLHALFVPGDTMQCACLCDDASGAVAHDAGAKVRVTRATSLKRGFVAWRVLTPNHAAGGRCRDRPWSQAPQWRYHPRS